MKDLEPEEMVVYEWMVSKIKKVFKRYGYQLVEPTFIESLDVLTRKSGEEIKDQIYHFKDKSGRELGLRFDLTVGISRLVASRQEWPKPLRLGAISCMWRYDRPGYGRSRWFYQWNIELMGVDSPSADAEVISLSIDILKSLGLKKFKVRIGNRKLTEEILKQIKVSNVPAALRVIDKIQKLSPEDLYKEFEKIDIGLAKAKEILRQINISGSPKQVLEKIKSFQAYPEMKALYTYLEAMGVLKYCIFDLTIVRGIGYYTGIVFEAYEEGQEDIGSLFGGGRYDSLVGLYGGQPLPSTGAGGGLERTILALKNNGLLPKDILPKPKVLVIPIGDVMAQTLNITTQIRECVPAMCLFKGTLSRGLAYANKNQISYAVLVGKKDLEAGCVTLRNMITGQESKIKIKDLKKTISNV
jgi:histidyl-tRNA synthetase